jgi:hypothetical protein
MSNNHDKGGQSEGHLTAKEISRWLVEGPAREAEAHLEGCFACQAKLVEAKAPLAVFRSTVIGWSEAQNEAGRRLPAGVDKNGSHLGFRLWLPVASLALAALLLVGFMKVPEMLRGHSTIGQQLVARTSSPDSDAVLMDQVDAEVSEAVPDAMAPLTDLVAWDSGAQPMNSTAAEKHAMRKKPAVGTGAKSSIHATD